MWSIREVPTPGTGLRWATGVVVKNGCAKRRGAAIGFAVFTLFTLFVLFVFRALVFFAAFFIAYPFGRKVLSRHFPRESQAGVRPPGGGGLKLYCSAPFAWPTNFSANIG